MNQNAVNDYTDALKDNPDCMPPIDVFQDSRGRLYCADGFHRITAHVASGLGSIKANVHKGDLKAAIRFAAGANAAHGVRLTTKDKHKKVSMLLSDPEYREMSDREVARIANVSAPFVAKVKGLMFPEPKAAKPGPPKNPVEVPAPEKTLEPESDPVPWYEDVAEQQEPIEQRPTPSKPVTHHDDDQFFKLMGQMTRTVDNRANFLGKKDEFHSKVLNGLKAADEAYRLWMKVKKC